MADQENVRLLAKYEHGYQSYRNPSSLPFN